MITIEKNIPIPTKAGRYNRYPFKQLKINESFFVPKGNRNNVSVAMAYFHRKNTNKRFVSRTVDNGIRVWRVI